MRPITLLGVLALAGCAGLPAPLARVGARPLAPAIGPPPAVVAPAPAPTPPTPAETLPAGGRVRPRPDSAGVLVFTFAEGAIFQVRAAPGRVTDLALEPGERLAETGAVAAGDTSRWIIGITRSGAGADQRAHVLIKPSATGLATNLVLATDRRAYHLELEARTGDYMPVVAWRYPAGSAAIAVPTRGSLNFGYRVRGDRVPWRPARVYDDGRQTVIEFPESIAQGQMPPLTLVGDGGEPGLVNYRVEGRRMLVDRLFAGAELRLGAGRHARTVRIERRVRP